MKQTKPVDYLKKYILFKSISSDFSECKKLLNSIGEDLTGLPLFIHKYNFENHPSMVITTKKGKKSKLILSAHLDVVDGSEEIFKPKIISNKLVGRGAIDMKYAAAMYIALLKEIGSELSKFDLAILLTTDEEVGGFNGVKKLLEMGFKADVCFLPDGGTNWVIEREAKGILHLKISAFGKSVHGSRVWEGQNAIDILTKAIDKIKTLFQTEPCNIKDHYHNTVNVGYINGGNSVNKVPDYAEAKLDIRFTSKHNPESLFKKIMAQTKNYGLKYEVLAQGGSFKTDIKNKYLTIYLQILKNKFNKKPKFQVSHGTSDARYFSSYNIPTIVTRPNGGSHHSEAEWIDLDDYQRFYETLKDFVTNVAK